MDNVNVELNQAKTYRWLFYICLLQFAVYFTIPAVQFPAGYRFYLEILGALTAGMFFAVFFLIVNIFCLIRDKHRKPLYITMIALMSAWIIWAIISWSYIEYMEYLLH